jgi:hypothetical protein
MKMRTASSTRIDDVVRRRRLIESISHGGPLESARRLQEMQRRQLLSGQHRQRLANPRPFERRIHPRWPQLTLSR